MCCCIFPYSIPPAGVMQLPKGCNIIDALLFAFHIGTSQLKAPVRSTPKEGKKMNICTKPGEVPCCLQRENDRLKRKLAKAMLAIKKLKKINRELKGQIVNVWLKDSHGIRAHSGT